MKSDARRDDRLALRDLRELEGRPSYASSSEIELESMRPVTADSKNNSPAMINIQNASFSWDIDGQPVVSDLSFTLQRKQLCFIIGPVGSGKSTMLKGLLGETPSTKGFVYSSFQDTSFVGQSPWIRNGTIQENVLGISSYEEAWYRQVVQACGLEGDVLMLPKGHGWPPKSVRLIDLFC
jgi:ABC-type multidrug transport system fused ATPase/permease subunit